MLVNCRLRFAARTGGNGIEQSKQQPERVCEAARRKEGLDRLDGTSQSNRLEGTARIFWWYTLSLRGVGTMNPFTGRPEWEPEPPVLAEIERSTQEAEKRDSRNPIVRFCGLCFILGLVGVGVLSRCSQPVVNSRHARRVVSRPVPAHRSHLWKRAHSSRANVLADRQTTTSVPAK